MSALLLLGACLLLGVLARRYLPVPDNAPAVIGFWVLNLAFPALVLAQIPKLALAVDLLFPAFAAWATFLGALLVFVLLGRLLGWTRGRIGALTLTAGLGNTAFMGLAMIESLRGADHLGPALIADQLGSFLALSTGGVLVAASCGGGVVTPPQIARRVLTFPPFLALAGGFLVRALGGWPAVVDGVLHRIGDTLVPMALFAVGLQLRLPRGDAQLAAPLALGLGWKLVAAPALVAATGLALGMRGVAFTAGVLQAAMAPMITAGLLAEQWHLDDALTQRIVGLGIVLSLATVVAWHAVLP